MDIGSEGDAGEINHFLSPYKTSIYAGNRTPANREKNINLKLHPYGEIRIPFGSYIDADMWEGFAVKASAVFWQFAFKGKDGEGNSVNIDIDITLPRKPPVKQGTQKDPLIKEGPLEKVTSIPITIAGNNNIYIGATLNEKMQANLLVDTGASRTALTNKMAKKLGISPTEKSPRRTTVVFGGRKIQVPFVKLASIQVGEARLNNLKVGVSEVSPERPSVDGVLGNDFLKHFKVTVDRAKSRLRLEPHDVALPNTPEAKYNFDRGITYYQDAQYDKAITLFSKVIEVNPRHNGAYHYRGLAYFQKKQYDNAISDFSWAIKYKPSFDKAHAGRGSAYIWKEEYDAAIADLNKAIEINSEYAIAYYNRGYAYRKIGEYDKAISDFNKAIELKPKYVEAYNSRGLAYARKKQYDEAISDFNKAVELNPKYYLGYNNLSWTLATCPDKSFRNGEKALETAKKVVAIRSDSRTLDTLAAAYAEAGKFEDAVKTQEQAIRQLKIKGKEEELEEFKERLNTYRDKKPWRE
ncbi:tetratricopeptide repeat protein [Thermodesulfobacteriota bacterium]